MTQPFMTDRRSMLGAALSMGALAALPSCRNRAEEVTVRYGITPYQDSALPVVADAKGWYRAAGLNVQLVPLTWDQVMPALTSKAVDVAIYNFNSFIPPYAAAAERRVRPVFYAPLFVFKGQAIMVQASSGFATVSSAGGDPAALQRIGAQLRGRRIGLTRGTELEQIVLATLKAGGLREGDATLIHAAPEDNLAAFRAGDLDAFAAGLTERIEARRRGATELVTQADVLSPVTDGLVTTEEFADAHSPILDQLLLSWFRTIQYISTNVRNNSAEIREYLRRSASTVYSPEEYEIAWSFNIFPTTPGDAASLFEGPNSAFNWRKSWDEVNRFLLEQKKIASPAPYTAYRGGDVLRRLASMAQPKAA